MGSSALGLSLPSPSNNIKMVFMYLYSVSIVTYYLT